MGRRFTVCAVLALSLACVHVFGAGGYTFTHTGRNVSYMLWEPRVDSLTGTPRRLGPGDVARADGMAIVLDEPGHYVFSSSSRGMSRLDPDEDGKSRLVWLRGSGALLGMDPDEIRGLRGIELNAWDDAIAAKFKHVDLERTCITIAGRARGRGAPPRPTLPEGLRYLAIDPRVRVTRAGCEAIAKQTELRYLATGGAVLDWKLLNGFAELRCLDLSGPGTGLPFSERRAPAIDLSALAGMPRLACIKASGVQVTALPRGTFPSLVYLEAVGTRLTDREVVRFAKANPQCTVLLGWNELLRWRAAGADRIEVEGSLDPLSRRSRKLAEVTGEDRVKRTIDRMVVHEEDNGCWCSLTPCKLLKFYRGETLLTQLAVHAPCHMVMAGWPDQAVIPRETRDFVQDWFAEIGVRESEKARDERKRNLRLWREMTARYEAFLPAAVARRLSPIEPTHKRVAAFETGVPDPVRRARLCFDLLERSRLLWRRRQFLTRRVLPGIPPQQVAEATRKALAQPERLAEMMHEPLARLFPGATRERVAAGIRAAVWPPPGAKGAAQWLLEMRGWRTLPKADLDGLLPQLAEIGLSHPHMHARRAALGVLAEVRTPVARTALRDCFEGHIPVRALREEDGADGADPLVDDSTGKPFSAKCSEPAIAGYLLATMGERDILPELRRRLAGAVLADRELLEAAIDILTREPKEKED